MATLYKLKGPSGDLLTIVHADTQLITGEGEARVIQEFPSPEAAQAHLERLAKIRRREGYGLLSVEDIDDAAAQAASDPLAGVCDWDASARRLGVAFRDGEGMAERCAALVDRIVATEARLLHFVCDPESPGDTFTAALAGKSLPTVEALIFDTYFQTVTRQSMNSIGDLAAVMRAMPRLRRLFATGDLALRRGRHDGLRELFLLGDPLDRSVLAGLSGSSFPALTDLGIKLASDAGPIDAGPVLAALRSIDAPHLATITIDGLADLAGALAALTSAPLPGSWRALHLSGSIDDEDAFLRALEAAAPRLADLEVLGLPLADDLSADAEAAARGLVPCLGDREEQDDVFLPTAYGEW